MNGDLNNSHLSGALRLVFLDGRGLGWVSSGCPVRCFREESVAVRREGASLVCR